MPLKPRLSKVRDAGLNPQEQKRHDELEKRYEGSGKELSDKEMDEFRSLHRRHVEPGRTHLDAKDGKKLLAGLVKDAAKVARGRDELKKLRKKV
jgi:hypothetical protein